MHLTLQGLVGVKEFLNFESRIWGSGVLMRLTVTILIVVLGGLVLTDLRKVSFNLVQVLLGKAGKPVLAGYSSQLQLVPVRVHHFIVILFATSCLRRASRSGEFLLEQVEAEIPVLQNLLPRLDALVHMGESQTPGFEGVALLGEALERCHLADVFGLLTFNSYLQENEILMLDAVDVGRQLLVVLAEHGPHCFAVVLVESFDVVGYKAGEVHHLFLCLLAVRIGQLALVDDLLLQKHIAQVYLIPDPLNTVPWHFQLSLIQLATPVIPISHIV